MAEVPEWKAVLGFEGGRERARLVRGRLAVREDGELNSGRRCAIMWVFPHVFTGVHSLVHYIIVKKKGGGRFQLTAAVGPLSSMPCQWPYRLSSKTVNLHNIDAGGIPEFMFCP